MGNTSTKYTFAAAIGDSPAVILHNRRFGARRMHPRRDEGGHDGGKGGDGGKADPPEGETAEQKTEREAAEKKALDAETAKNNAKALKDAEKRAKDAEEALEAKNLESASDAEKQVAATVKEKVKEAVDAKELELTDHFTGQIKALQGQIITGTIESTLKLAGREAKDYPTAIATLDKSTFVDDDGAVKVSEVAKWATELAGAALSRPPRTGGTRTSGSSNRGFGRYLNRE